MLNQGGILCLAALGFSPCIFLSFGHVVRYALLFARLRKSLKREIYIRERFRSPAESLYRLKLMNETNLYSFYMCTKLIESLFNVFIPTVNLLNIINATGTFCTHRSHE